VRLSPHPSPVAFIVEAPVRAWVKASSQASENLRDVAAIEPNSISGTSQAGVGSPGTSGEVMRTGSPCGEGSWCA
jgi:hypothetical protein